MAIEQAAMARRAAAAQRRGGGGSSRTACGARIVTPPLRRFASAPSAARMIASSADGRAVEMSADDAAGDKGPATRSAEVDDLRDLRRIEQHRAARRRRSRGSADRSRAWCRRRCRASDRRAAGRGFPRAAIWRSRSSAGCRRRRRRRRRATARAGRHRRAEAPPPRPRSPPPYRSEPKRTKRSITGSETLCGRSSLSEQRLGLAILGHQADADIRARWHRVGEVSTIGSPVDRRCPRGQLGHAETGEEQIELAHALQAGNAQHLARLQSEASARAACRRSRALGAAARSAPAGARRAARRESVGERAADDHADHLVIAHRRTRLGADAACRCAAPSAGRRSAGLPAGDAK